jgi:phosphopantothenoylcysteine decarboxylase/phosphopantothenate--cysteine ligase
MASKNVLFFLTGSIACAKACTTISRLVQSGVTVQTVVTPAALHFIGKATLEGLSGRRAYDDLWAEGAALDHIEFARKADLALVCPATANTINRFAAGLADDLAGALFLAHDRAKPFLIAPAMNPAMWSHPATARNVAALVADGVRFVGPNAGEMAESGEAGIGRMAEPLEIVAALEALLAPAGAGLLAGRHVLVTSGPTHEPIDPVRYLANRSSGRQGHAIAAAAAAAGARVTLVSGPVEIPDPAGVATIHVETAAEMLEAVEAALPADVAVMAAAVADWRPVAASPGKIKKDGSGRTAPLALAENPDILATVGRHHTLRPTLVIGFAAETDDLIRNAQKKLAAKGADWILANDVSPGTGIMGGEENSVRVVSAAGVEDWPRLKKSAVATRLVAKIAEALHARREAAK